MPRPPRADVAGDIYHALNRGNGRQRVFHKEAESEAFRDGWWRQQKGGLIGVRF